MGLRRISFFLFALCVGGAFPLVLWAGIAAAQVQGGCVLTVNGRDANTASTPADAIEVDHNSTASVSGQAPFQVSSHDIDLEFAGFRWTASSGVDNGNSWSGPVNVKHYATYGVGIYKVVGISNGAGGRSCSGDAFIKVTGKNAL